MKRYHLLPALALALALLLPACGSSSETDSAAAATADSGSGMDRAAPLPEPSPPFTGPLPAASAEAERDVPKVLRVAGFLAAYPISEADQHSLQAQLLREYENDKANYPGIITYYDLIMRTPSDMQSSAAARKQLWQLMAPLIHDKPAGYRDSMFGMILKYNPVVYTDGKTIITKADVQNRLATLTVLAKAGDIEEKQRDENEVVLEECRKVADNFESLPAAEQDALNFGEAYYYALNDFLSSQGPARAQAVAYIKEHAQTGDDLPAVQAPIVEQANAYAAQQISAQSAAFRRDMQELMETNQFITNMGTAASQNTKSQSQLSKE